MDTNKPNDAVEALDVRDGSDDPIQKCEHCDGYGVISYNPNLNPNSFAGSATCKCKHCGGSGIADYPNTQGLVTPGNGRGPEEGASSRRHQ